MQENVSKRMLKNFPGRSVNYRSLPSSGEASLLLEKRGGLGAEPCLFTKKGAVRTNEESLQEYITHPFIWPSSLRT